MDDVRKNRVRVKILILLFLNRTCANFENRSADKVLIAKMNFE